MVSATVRLSALRLLAAVAVLAAIPIVVAHGDDEADMDMGEGMDMDTMPQGEPETAPEGYETYFAHQGHAVKIYTHIALMVVSWGLVLPIGVMFSIARSRFTLPVQILFTITNALGVFIGMSYNAHTPDLYPNNAHHKLGWLVTWVMAAQVCICVVGRVGGVLKRDEALEYNKEERRAFMPISTQAMADHQSAFAERYRPSHDSGDRNPESLRSNSMSTMVGQESPVAAEFDGHNHNYDDDLDDLEFKPAEMTGKQESSSWAAKIASKISSRAWTPLVIAYNTVDRLILILGYVALCTGTIAYGRFFEGHGIFSGLAHWIKGSIFFWYGILTLGRWSGSFGDLGWAWNVRPKQSSQRWRPSAEFVEGFLIFFYGSTNIFLEHLANADEPISPQDLEHISITVLFIGGGALSMLIESTKIRDLLNTTVTDAALAHPEHAYGEEEREALETPTHYEFSINPIPALVILLTGIMMSSHTQQEMTSSMVHKQWGQLLSGASFARFSTYVILYLKPPKSILPSRPPTELLTAFGLISSGLLFMASAEDTIQGMINYQLDAMFMYTVMMGLVGLLMAWIVIVIAFKGWAVRKESARSLKAWSLTSRV